MTAQQHGASHPSNRTFIEQCKRWGAIEHRVSGEWTTLRLPNRALVDVRSAHTHQGNARKTMLEAVSALGVNLAEFWQGPQVGMVLPATEAPAGNIIDVQLGIALIDNDAPVDEIREAIDALRAAADGSNAELYVDDEACDRVLAGLDEVEQIERQIVAEQETGGPDMAVTEVVPIRSPRVQRNRGLTNRIFDLLVDTGSPLSCALIAERIEVVGDTAQQSNAISNACSWLVKLGVVRRVKPGVYAAVDAKPADHAIDVRVSTEHEHHAQPAPPRMAQVPQSVIDEVVAIDAPPWPDQGESPAGGFDRIERAAITPTVESIDGEVDTVLDLLFPHGMNVRASDLRAINAWVDATKALLRQVRS